jgi:integrase/recombinase XerD
MVPNNSSNVDVDRLLRQALPLSTATSLCAMMEGYRLSARSEGKSGGTIAIVESSVRYLRQFLEGEGLSPDVREIGATEMRRFIVSLRERPRFASHRFTRPQGGRLSGHTINGYLRALRSFWSWLESEGFIEENPFRAVRIPKAPIKVIPTFTDEQLRALFGAVDSTSPVGCRDYAIMLMLLDTGIRCSELTGLRLTDVDLNGRLLKVHGKGNKERMVPIGAKVQKAVWKYLNCHRPQPATSRYDHVFLTRDGRPLSKDRLEAIVERHGTKAGIFGVRVSPHTFRHTMAVTFLRNGGDVFSLQRITGHSQLDVLRGYVNLAQSDISRVHERNSPADNLELPGHRKDGRTRVSPKKPKSATGRIHGSGERSNVNHTKVAHGSSQKSPRIERPANTKKGGNENADS